VRSDNNIGDLATLLQLIDESDARKDLVARRETKYVIQGMDVTTLRSVLEGNATRLIHNDEVSTVRSIYFDDSSLSACHANLSGLGHRRKLRLRWYDRPLPGNECYLEVKWRNNRVTGKHRVKMKCDSSLAELPYRHWGELLLKHVPCRMAADVVRYSDPIVIVEYKREHFAFNFGSIRSTIDYDLRFYDQTGKPSVCLNFPQPKYDFIVLEGKTPVGCEYMLREMLYPMQLRPQRCSKYVYGCQMLGFVQL
jgi:VTC domain